MFEGEKKPLISRINRNRRKNSKFCGSREKLHTNCEYNDLRVA